MSKESFSVKIKRIIYLLLNDLPLFGFKVSMAKINMVIHNGSFNSTVRKNKVILQYLKDNNHNLIDKYRNHIISNQENDTNQGPIWVFWWQGYDNMPEIIKTCYHNSIWAASGRSVILIDQNNITDYIDFPEFVWAQFKEGKLKIQHLADMLRIRLLKEYGGLWLDASIYCIRSMDRDIFNKRFYSLKSNPDELFVSEGRWTTFVIGGIKSYMLFEFLDDFFIEYCRAGKPFIDYFMFDTAIAIAYDAFPEFKKDIDSLPLAEKGFYWLTEHLENKYTDVADELSEQSNYQKIGWAGCIEKDYSNESVYHSIISKNRNNEKS